MPYSFYANHLAENPNDIDFQVSSKGKIFSTPTLKEFIIYTCMPSTILVSDMNMNNSGIVGHQHSQA